MSDQPILDEIKKTVESNDVVLFMKGTKMFPQCGFSSRVKQILDYLEVDFKDVNVLESDEMRQGIKDFTDWPTTPQLYVKGEFVGGCDIVTEMTLQRKFESPTASFSILDVGKPAPGEARVFHIYRPEPGTVLKRRCDRECFGGPHIAVTMLSVYG